MARASRLRHGAHSARSSKARATGTDACKASSRTHQGRHGDRCAAREEKSSRDLRFYLVLLALCVSSLLSALDMTGLGTLLPTITADLDSSEYQWIGSAFVLASTAFVPVTGSMASIVGRRSTLLVALVLFALGSAVCGAAPNMTAMIAGRALQGAGGGGVIVMTEIVLVDLVPLAERGVFLGIIGLTWAVSSSFGPVLGGAFAQSGLWRWFFYLNVPVTAVAFVLVAVCLSKLKTPDTTLRERVALVDWANALFVAATASTIIAMAWAGDIYPWSSWRVLVPLLLGLAGLVAYVIIEKTLVRNPTVPFEILSHPMSVLGYLCNFVHGTTILAVIYYIPSYYQAVQEKTPIQSGIDLLSLSFVVAPMGIVTGIIITATGRYKWINIVGWIFTVLGLGLMWLMTADAPAGIWLGLPVIFSIGAGILFCAPLFPILAPLPIDKQPHAMAFHAFTRLWGNSWGVCIGITVIQNELMQRLPPTFIDALGRRTGIAYAAIPSIPDLPEPLREQVREAYADSLRICWVTMAGLAGIGLLASLFIHDLPLATATDAKWGLKESNDASAEGSSGGGETRAKDRPDLKAIHISQPTIRFDTAFSWSKDESLEEALPTADPWGRQPAQTSWHYVPSVESLPATNVPSQHGERESVLEITLPERFQDDRRESLVAPSWIGSGRRISLAGSLLL